MHEGWVKLCLCVFLWFMVHIIMGSLYFCC